MASTRSEEGGPLTTRLRLIRAARTAFARDGYRGATVRGITRDAGVNVGAVSYHFGSKEELYHAVLRDVLEPLQGRVLKACEEPGNTRGRLIAVMRAFFEHLLANPDQPRFMVGIRPEEDRFPQPVLEMVAPVVSSLTDLVQEGQGEGLVRPGPPILFVLSLLSQPIYFSIAIQRAPEGTLSVDSHGRKDRRILLEHMIRFALLGLGIGPPGEGDLIPATMEEELE